MPTASPENSGLNMAAHRLFMACSADPFDEDNIGDVAIVLSRLVDEVERADGTAIQEQIADIHSWATEHTCTTLMGETLMSELLKLAGVDSTDVA